MGFRFRRTLKIAPGLHVNLSKSGPSLSVGPRGAHYTVGPRGDRATVGIPGTGLSYTTTGKSHRESHSVEYDEDGSPTGETEAPEGDPNLLLPTIALFSFLVAALVRNSLGWTVCEVIALLTGLDFGVRKAFKLNHGPVTQLLILAVAFFVLMIWLAPVLLGIWFLYELVTCLGSHAK